MRSVLLISFLFAMVSCASQQEQKHNPFDPLTLDRLLVVGKTQQGQILKELGSPNIVSKDSKKGEVWTYTRMSYDHGSSHADVGLLALGAVAGMWFLPGISGGSSSSSSSSKSMDLVLSFAEGDLLSDYSIVKTTY